MGSAPGQSLVSSRAQIVDYYTREEEQQIAPVSFRKSKKSKKKRSARIRDEDRHQDSVDNTDDVEMRDAPLSPPRQEQTFHQSNATSNIDDVISILL